MTDEEIKKLITETIINELRVVFGLESAIGKLILTKNLQILDKIKIQLGTDGGLTIGTGVDQKFGLWGTTPVVQPAGAAQAALTNSTGGTANTVIDDVGGTFNQAVLNNNFTELYTLLTAIRTALVSIGIIKGSA